MAQNTQRNAASCIITQRKTGCVSNAVLRFRASCLEFVVVSFIVLWFVCEYLPDLRETLGFICADCLSTLACYSPADSADHAETNAASCIISQTKTDW